MTQVWLFVLLLVFCKLDPIQTNSNSKFYQVDLAQPFYISWFLTHFTIWVLIGYLNNYCLIKYSDAWVYLGCVCFFLLLWHTFRGKSNDSTQNKCKSKSINPLIKLHLISFLFFVFNKYFSITSCYLYYLHLFIFSFYLFRC